MKHITSRYLRGALGRRERYHELIRCGTVYGNLRAPAYRVGEEFRWTTDDPRREAVILGIDPECLFARDADGEVLVSRGRCPAWFGLTHAMWLGWCWVVTPESTGRRQAVGYAAGERLYARSAGPRALRVQVWLGDGTRSIETSEGEYLFMRGECAATLPLRNALEAGWCKVPSGCRDRLEAQFWVAAAAQADPSLLTREPVKRRHRGSRRERVEVSPPMRLLTADR